MTIRHVNCGCRHTGGFETDGKGKTLITMSAFRMPEHSSWKEYPTRPLPAPSSTLFRRIWSAGLDTLPRNTRKELVNVGAYKHLLASYLVHLVAK